MPNLYFSFKQFKVYHNRCAMKVGTDGVLLGAWTAIDDISSILDVGTGTGLVAMMLAQRLSDRSLVIEAIDIDHDAIDQARQNASEAGFENIKVERFSLQSYVEQTDRKYDLIVSNPPFFVSSLQSPDDKRTLARHASSLSMEELICCSRKLLSKNGRLSIIYPYQCKATLVNLADQYNFYISRITDVYPTPVTKPKRILMELSVQKRDLEENSIVIEVQRHQYSREFICLVKDFYLKL